MFAQHFRAADFDIEAFPFHATSTVVCHPLKTLFSYLTLISSTAMANVARSSLRRFTTQAARQATVSYAAPAAEQVNNYGIRVSQAQGTVDALTGGEYKPLLLRHAC